MNGTIDPSAACSANFAPIGKEKARRANAGLFRNRKDERLRR